MAKQNGKHVAIASFLVVVIAWVSSGLTSYVGNVHQTGDTAADVVELKEEGCDPARAHSTSIAVIETKIEALKEQEQSNTEAILKAIREKN